MPAITTITDEARIVADNSMARSPAAASPTVRLGVTGLSRAGKTVFITALVHNLVHGGRLPLFDAYQAGRLAEARLKPQPDDEVPRFDYEAHVRDLVERRVWPNSTRRISELRIVIEYEFARYLKRAARPRTAQSRHRRLSRRVAARPRAAEEDLRRMVGRGAGAVARAASRAASQPDGMRRSPASTRTRPKTRRRRAALAEAFTRYLRAARADEHALSMLPPGRFLMPGDLEGSPALTFAPLDIAADHSAGGEHARGDDGAPLRGLQDACREAVLPRPFRAARPADRAGRHAGRAECRAGGASATSKTALADVLSAFRPGRASWLTLDPDAPDRPHPLRRDQGGPRAPLRPRQSRAAARSG